MATPALELRNLLARIEILVQRHLAAIATYPVLTLPAEITQEIFVHCLPPSTVNEFDETGIQIVVGELAPRIGELASDAPMLLLRICRAWRDIALSTPELWSTLQLQIERVDPGSGVVPKETSMIEAYIDQWFSRAAQRPLALGFHRDDDDDPLMGCEFPTDCSLSLSQDDLDELGLDKMDFPLLQRATLGYAYGPDPNSDDPVVIFENAPQFHSISLIGPASLSYYTLPSLQLTTFDGGISDLQLFTIAPNLTEVKCAVEYLHPQARPTSKILHSRLQSLALVAAWEAPEDILQCLTLPVLQCLHISQMADSTYSSLHSFLTRSSPPLSSLSIRGDDFGFRDWQDCLSSVATTLEDLELEDPLSRVQRSIFSLHRFVGYIGEPSGISPPLPKLQRLKFLSCKHIDYRELQSFLEARSSESETTEVTPLQSFRLVWKDDTYLASLLGAGSETDSITRYLTNSSWHGVDIYIGTKEKNYLVVEK
ncbi:hypothetical protein DFH06DRAFT_1464158 [Mycena polygramma]|nr:hypothetical protein DFH06DRAFT_1464158 [Mycena polygramma]